MGPMTGTDIINEKTNSTRKGTISDYRIKQKKKINHRSNFIKMYKNWISFFIAD